MQLSRGLIQAVKVASRVEHKSKFYHTKHDLRVAHQTGKTRLGLCGGGDDIDDEILDAIVETTNVSA
ncbi:hypothetical protein L1987_58301 [Smallanthus sonchifolius]|uniref:Uncharacterized protein n=1 Tax=Smallanthus sonchifolius TaxID=185202 RepID=A0ACB9DFI7_9ASTR|nr:hypothetical protein L1987_58301 [Smallanthus sonchifolius]